MKPPVLTSDALLAYEEVLRRNGVPAVDRLRAGVDDAAMDRQTEALGLRLPDEARTWFRWHDGVEHDGPDRLSMIAPSFLNMSLDEAVSWHGVLRDIGLGISDPQIRERFWDPTWFPLIRERQVLVCDCSVPAGSPTPIRVTCTEGVNDWRTIQAQSLGELVGLWMRSWEIGAWYYDRERQMIARRFNQPKPDGTPNYLLDI